MVNVDRRLSFASVRQRVFRQTSIVEPELDMVRNHADSPPLSSRISRFVEWLLPDRGVASGVKRSVARELEETFPVHEF